MHYVSPNLSQPDKNLVAELLRHRCFHHDHTQSGYWRAVSLKALNTKSSMRITIDAPTYHVPIHYIPEGPDREQHIASCLWHFERVAEINDAYDNACEEARYVDGAESPYDDKIDFQISLERMVAPFELRWFAERYPDEVLELLNGSVEQYKHTKNMELGIEIGSVNETRWLGACNYFSYKKPGFALIHSCGKAWFAIHGPLPAAIGHSLDTPGQFENLALSRLFDAPFLAGADHRIESIQRSPSKTVFYFEPLRSTVTVPKRCNLST